MSKTVAIIGSSGNVGSATLKALSKFPNIHVRAGVRDPVAGKAKVGDFPNVTYVKASAEDVDSVTELFRGADAVFVNVPATENRADLAKNSIEAATRAHVPALVVLSVATADLHGTIFGDQFAQVESAARASGAAYTLLRAPVFIENKWGIVGSVKGQAKFYGPVGASVPYTPVAVSDIGDSVAAVLANPGPHANRVYTLTAPSVTEAEVATILSSIVGKPVEYVQVPYDGAREAFRGFGMPDWQINGVFELFQLMEKKSPVTNNPTKDIEHITGHPPVDVPTWLRNHSFAFQ